jgi:hypothetical protein
MTKVKTPLSEPTAISGSHLVSRPQWFASRLPPEPELADANEVYARVGLKRGLLYKLDDEKEIESIVLKRRNYARGKRLFVMASIRRFLAKCQEGSK